MACKRRAQIIVEIANPNENARCERDALNWQTHKSIAQAARSITSNGYENRYF